MEKRGSCSRELKCLIVFLGIFSVIEEEGKKKEGIYLRRNY